MTLRVPSTIKRVRLHTNKYINEKIKENTLRNISYYTGKDNKEIIDRIESLNREWDIERVLETNAASVVILSTIFGFKVNKKWFALSGIAGAFLLQHAIQGWCPPVPVFRRLGVRTSSEINYEKQALKNLLNTDKSFS